MPPRCSRRCYGLGPSGICKCNSISHCRLVHQRGYLKGIGISFSAGLYMKQHKPTASIPFLGTRTPNRWNCSLRHLGLCMPCPEDLPLTSEDYRKTLCVNPGQHWLLHQMPPGTHCRGCSCHQPGTSLPSSCSQGYRGSVWDQAGGLRDSTCLLHLQQDKNTCSQIQNQTGAPYHACRTWLPFKGDTRANTVRLWERQSMVRRVPCSPVQEVACISAEYVYVCVREESCFLSYLEVC